VGIPAISKKTKQIIYIYVKLCMGAEELKDILAEQDMCVGV